MRLDNIHRPKCLGFFDVSISITQMLLKSKVVAFSEHLTELINTRSRIKIIISLPFVPIGAFYRFTIGKPY